MNTLYIYIYLYLSIYLSRSGQVVTAATLHKEAGTVYTMLAKVEDKGGRLGSQATSAQLVVRYLLYTERREKD